MRVRALVAALAVATASSGLVAATAAASDSPTAATSAITVEGADGAFLLGAGQSLVSAGSAVGVAAGPGSLRFTTSASLGSFATFTFPTGSAPAAGTFQAQRMPGDPTSTAGFDLEVGSHGCNLIASTVVVHQVAVDGSGTITSFAATYSARCDSQPPVTGELRYASTVPYERFGWMTLGTQSPVHTVTVHVPAATTYGTATVEGVDADAFRPVLDTCSGRTFAAGATCTIGVIARPSHSYAQAADLRLPADTGDQVVGLTTSGQDTATGSYVSVPPARILDTRKRIGVTTTTPLPAGYMLDVRVAGAGGLPSSGISSVVVNLTAVTPSATGYLTAYPSGATRPTASSVSFTARSTTANLVTVPVGANGMVRLYNYTGSTHVLADVVGYYHATTLAPVGAADTDFESETTPFRILDTRQPGYGALPSGYYQERSVDFGAYDSRVRALAVNVTVVAPQTAGYLTAWDGEGPLPSTSTVNFDKGATVANMAIVRTGVCPSDCTYPGAPTMGFYNGSAGSVHVVVDVVGVYYQGLDGDHGWRYRPLPTPTRYLDSRKGLGLTGPVPADTARPVDVPSTVAGYNTYAVVSNLTVAAPTAHTYLTLWRNDPADTRPGVSNINANAGQIVSNMAITEVWTHNDFQIYNAVGSTPVVADAAGTMEAYPGTAVPPGQVAVAGQRATAAAIAPVGHRAPGVLSVRGGAATPLR